MAEVAAGAVVAEQVVSTGIEAGAAVAVAQPALPLRASFHQIASAQAQDDSLELARSHHTTTVLGNKAYIFGGKSGDKTLCSNNLSGIALPVNNQPPGGSEYVCYPAVSLNEAVPPPRFSHAACARDDTLVVHGGRGDDESPLDESCLWVWSSKTLQWDKLSFVGKIPPPRYGHRILLDEEQDILILHGGFGTNGPVTETWLFDFKSYEWTELPSAPEATLASQLVNSTLFAISGSSDVNGSIHVLQLDPLSREKALKEELEWSTFDFPTNPLTPGPRPRTGGALVPVTTGLGRHYLISILGSRRDVEMTSSNQDFTKSHPFYSDVWALQLPSAGYSASQAKDTVRDYLPGFESGSLSWGEISFTSTESTNTTAQNHHPGPRAYFGADICPDGKNVFIWGGLNTKEERQADGWLLRVE